MHLISEDSLVIIGGKDEFGISADEIREFNFKLMKEMPNDWKLPSCLSGFGSCLLKSNLFSCKIIDGTLAICGGSIS